MTFFDKSFIGKDSMPISNRADEGHKGDSTAQDQISPHNIHGSAGKSQAENASFVDFDSKRGVVERLQSIESLSNDGMASRKYHRSNKPSNVGHQGVS